MRQNVREFPADLVAAWPDTGVLHHRRLSDIEVRSQDRTPRCSSHRSLLLLGPQPSPQTLDRACWRSHNHRWIVLTLCENNRTACQMRAYSSTAGRCYHWVRCMNDRCHLMWLKVSDLYNVKLQYLGRFNWHVLTNTCHAVCGVHVTFFWLWHTHRWSISWTIATHCWSVGLEHYSDGCSQYSVSLFDWGAL